MVRYIKGLPNGLDSYPSCLAKASMYPPSTFALFHRTSAASQFRLLRSCGTGTRRARGLLEVHYIAFIQALTDIYRMDEPTLLNFWYRFMAQVNNSKLYDYLFQRMTPAIMVRGVSAIWTHFHRGSTLTSNRTGGHYDWIWRFRRDSSIH